jgi:hypothetical protein
MFDPCTYFPVTISGSFRRHMCEIGKALYELKNLGFKVLSPKDPHIVSEDSGFLYVASDPIHSVKFVQNLHFSCIQHSLFLWLVCPDGYVGPSASMEVGYALAHRIPVCTVTCPSDITLQQYVHVLPSIDSVRSYIFWGSYLKGL